MKLGRLTPSGQEQFASYLQQLRANSRLAPPRWLLNDPDASAVVRDLEVHPRAFASRLDVAQFLDELFTEAEIAPQERDAGFWAWLSLWYIDVVCPEKSGQGRKPSSENFRYIPAMNNFQKYYRHLLLGPYVIFQSHRDHVSDAMALLTGPVHVINDVIEQLASRLEWISNRAVIGAATRLYVEPASRSYKRGAGGKGAGSPRRLSVVLDQFDLTYDLFGLRPDELLGLLPREFDRFKS